MAASSDSARQHRVYHRLQFAAHRIQKAADRALLEAADITTAQAAVLSVVAAGGGAAMQRDVARQLGLNESAITAMANRLLGMDLLERERDEADARAWRLALTKEGRAVLKRIEKPFRSINETTEAALTTAGVAQFAEALTRIADAFDPG